MYIAVDTRTVKMDTRDVDIRICENKMHIYVLWSH